MNKAKPTRKKIKNEAKGFDLGQQFHVLNMVDFEWVQNITNSDVGACGYGYRYVDELKTHIPSLMLLAKNANLIKKAFDEIYSWTEDSDDDAVLLDFIFLKSGEYLLGISREPERALARVSYPALFDPLQFVSTWIKRLDSTNPFLFELQKRQKELVAPIAVEPMTLHSGLGASTMTPFGGAKTIDGTRPLIKFECGFSHEEDHEMSASAQVILQTYRSRDRKASKVEGSGPPEPTPMSTKVKRQTVMQEMFPLTIFRARRLGILKQVRARLKVKSVSDWQIEQAICNLVLSNALHQGSKHYSGVATGKLHKEIASLAKNYKEVADGNTFLDKVPAEDVVTQVWLDADDLTSRLKETPRDGSLSSRMSILRRRGFLD